MAKKSFRVFLLSYRKRKRERKGNRNLRSRTKVCQIDDRQTLFSGICHRIRSAAAGFDAIGHTNAAFVHQMSVAPVHTAAGVIWGQKHHFIGASHDVAVAFLIRFAPVFCLLRTEQHQNQADLWDFFRRRSTVRAASVSNPNAPPAPKYHTPCRINWRRVFPAPL